MTPRAAALALAAPLLLAAPALADHGHGKYKRGGATISVQTGNGGFYINTGNRGYSTYGNRGYGNYGYNRGYGVNEWGQSRWEVRELKQRAVRECRRAIHREASYIGFRDVDFEDGRRVRQIGPNGFVVSFNEVEFEGRRRDFERPVTCTIRRGNVRFLEGVPQPGHRGHHGDRRYRKYSY